MVASRAPAFMAGVLLALVACTLVSAYPQELEHQRRRSLMEEQQQHNHRRAAEARVWTAAMPERVHESWPEEGQRWEAHVDREHEPRAAGSRARSAREQPEPRAPHADSMAGASIAARPGRQRGSKAAKTQAKPDASADKAASTPVAAPDASSTTTKPAQPGSSTTPAQPGSSKLNSKQGGASKQAEGQALSKAKKERPSKQQRDADAYDDDEDEEEYYHAPTYKAYTPHGKAEGKDQMPAYKPYKSGEADGAKVEKKLAYKPYNPAEGEPKRRVEYKPYKPEAEDHDGGKYHEEPSSKYGEAPHREEEPYSPYKVGYMPRGRYGEQGEDAHGPGGGYRGHPHMPEGHEAMHREHEAHMPHMPHMPMDPRAGGPHPWGPRGGRYDEGPHGPRPGPYEGPRGPQHPEGPYGGGPHGPPHGGRPPLPHEPREDRPDYAQVEEPIGAGKEGKKGRGGGKKKDTEDKEDKVKEDKPKTSHKLRAYQPDEDKDDSKPTKKGYEDAADKPASKKKHTPKKAEEDIVVEEDEYYTAPKAPKKKAEEEEDDEYYTAPKAPKKDEKDKKDKEPKKDKAGEAPKKDKDAYEAPKDTKGEYEVPEEGVTLQEVEKSDCMHTTADGGFHFKSSVVCLESGSRYSSNMLHGNEARLAWNSDILEPYNGPDATCVWDITTLEHPLEVEHHTQQTGTAMGVCRFKGATSACGMPFDEGVTMTIQADVFMVRAITEMPLETAEVGSCAPHHVSAMSIPKHGDVKASLFGAKPAAAPAGAVGAAEYEPKGYPPPAASAKGKAKAKAKTATASADAAAVATAASSTAGGYGGTDQHFLVTADVFVGEITSIRGATPGGYGHLAGVLQYVARVREAQPLRHMDTYLEGLPNMKQGEYYFEFSHK